MSFEFDKAKAILRSCKTEKSKADENGNAVLKNDVNLYVVVDSRCKDAVEHLFPGYEAMESAIAKLSSSHSGVKLSAPGKTPELFVSIFDGGGQKEIFRFNNVTLNGSPTLSINSLGDSKLTVRLAARLSKKDMGQLVDHIDQDIYVSVSEQQLVLPGVTTSAPSRAVVSALEATRAIDGDESDDDDDDESMGTTAEQMRAWRDESGLTRADMIDRLALLDPPVLVAVKSLQRYETGARSAPADVVDGVKEICHVD